MIDFRFRTIRGLLAWSLGLSLVAAFVLMTSILSVWLESRFQNIEQLEIKLHIERVRDIVENEITSLHPMIKDWAEWDDMYEHVQSPNPSFLESNFYPEVLDQISVDSMRVYDLKARLVNALDRKSSHAGEPDIEGLLRTVDLRAGVFPSAAETEPRAGLVVVNSQLFRYTILPIRNSKGNLPPAGFVIFFKIIDKAFELKLQQLTKTNLRMRLLGTKGLAENLNPPIPTQLLKQLKRKPLLEDQPFFIKKKAWIRSSDQDITVGLVAKDSKGSDRLLLDFPVDRLLMREGKKIISTLVYALLGVTILVLSFQTQIVNRITGRLLDLVRQLEQLSQSHKPGQRLQPSGRDELRSLAKSFNGLLQVIDHNQAGMRAILENVRSGFLILDQEARIYNGATRMACQIFHRDSLDGVILPNLLYANQKDRDHFIILFEQLFDELIPLELSLGQLPSKFRIGLQHLKIDWVPLLREDGKVYAVISTLHDVTHLDEVEDENETNLALIKILRNRSGFQSLLEDTREALQSGKKTFVSENTAAQQRWLRRTLHTIKGNMGVFGLQAIARFIHEIEDRDHISLEELEAVESAIVSFLKAHFAILEADYDGVWDPYYRVFQSQLSSLQQKSQTWQDLRQAQISVEQFASEVMRYPVQQLLEPMIEDAQRLAKKLGKRVRIDLDGGSMRIDAVRYKAFLKNLVHLMRNAIVHGLEEPGRRRGKPEVGQLRIGVREDAAEALIFHIEDDGQGIATKRLCELAVESGLISAAKAEQMSEAEALELIFLDGLSTQRQASEVAGRGVGMSALRQSVQGLGGLISVDSKPGRGTSIQIKFPALVEGDDCSLRSSS